MRIKYITAAILLFMAAGCDQEDNEDGIGIQYGLITDCLWVPADYSDRQTMLPELVLNPEYPIYFTSGGDMVVLHENDGMYSYEADYKYKIDSDSDILVLTSQEEEYYFTFHALCLSHMTLFFKDKPSEYVVYTREPFPDEGDIEQGDPGSGLEKMLDRF